MLLKAQFESPVRETRARVELIHLGQKKGENTSTYMARTKTLLHKVPGYDLKTALQQWVLGLRQPYRLEAAKASPQTLAEAERLVARLEDAMEFVRASKDESGTGKASGGDQKKEKKDKNAGKSGGTSGTVQQQGQRQEGGKSFKGNKKNFSTSTSGQGSAGQSSRPPQQQSSQSYRGPQNVGGSGQKGRGKTNQRRPRVAVMANADELRRWPIRWIGRRHSMPPCRTRMHPCVSSRETDWPRVKEASGAHCQGQSGWTIKAIKISPGKKRRQRRRNQWRRQVVKRC